MFVVIFFITITLCRMRYGYFLVCEQASAFLIFVKKIPKMRPCTWCVFPHGESSPLRRCLGSCAEVCLQKALYTEGLKYNVLAATKQLYESFSPSVCLSVTPFQQCCHHRIVMKISGVITIDRSDVCAKKNKIWCQKSRSQRSQPNLAVSGP